MSQSQANETHSDLTHDLVALDLVDLAPSAHDPCIIGCNNGNLVHTLALQIAVLLNVGRKVVCLAARGESTLMGMYQ